MEEFIGFQKSFLSIRIQEIVKYSQEIVITCNDFQNTLGSFTLFEVHESKISRTKNKNEYFM